MALETIDVNDSFINKLAGAITSGISSAAGPRKVTAAQYDPKTPWQPVKKLAHKVKYTAYQNGYRVPVKRLTNAEIDNLNAIVRPGRYINRMVEVVLWDEGGSIHLDLRYNNKSPDQRSENKNHWRNFEELTGKIVAEQNAILAKKQRTDKAVERILSLSDDKPEDEDSDDTEINDDEGLLPVENDPDILLSRDPETRVEATAPTPKQEAARKKTTRQSFSSAKTREARAKAEARA